MQVIREIRNGLDHRLKHTTVLDFEIQTDGNILSPTIELAHKKTKLQRTSLSEFLEISVQNILVIVEETFAHLASKNQTSGGIPKHVKLIPEERRWNKFVKYSFWSPIGEGGYFSQ